MQAEAARERYRDALSKSAASLQTGLREEQATFAMNTPSTESDVHQHLAAAAFHLRPIIGPQQTNLLTKAVRRYLSCGSGFDLSPRDGARRFGDGTAAATGLDHVHLAKLCRNLLWERLFTEFRHRSWRTRRRSRTAARAKPSGRRS